MSKSFKYVKEFEFPREAGYTGSAGQQMVKGYARGGKTDAAQDKAMVKSAVHKHEKSMHKGEPLTKLAHGGKIKDTIRNEREEMARIKQETRSERKDAGEEMSRVRKEMRYDEAKMKNDRPMRKQYPVDRSEPIIPMKHGGMKHGGMKHGGMKHGGMTEKPMMMKHGGMNPKQEAKVGKVMGEFKEGKLHSGSKSGPKVNNRKQAVAIAMNEARNMGKKKK